MFKHILIPVDVASPAAAAGAMSIAKHLTDLMGAQLTVATIIDSSVAGRGLVQQETQAALDDFVAEHSTGGVAVSGHLQISGSVSAGIRDCIGKLGVDLVVMASHDPTRTDAPIGSNAAHVAQHTGCSVMIVR